MTHLGMEMGTMRVLGRDLCQFCCKLWFDWKGGIVLAFSAMENGMDGRQHLSLFFEMALQCRR